MKKRISYFFISIISFSLLCICQPAISAQENNGQKPITSAHCNIFTFDASGSYDPDNEKISFLWDFGDGQTSTEPVIEHEYEESGVYTVTLTVTDESNLACSSSVSQQKVLVNQPPHAAFTSKDKACVNQGIVFDGHSSFDDSKNKLTYLWNFGDGTKRENEILPTKFYTKGGDYKVILSINDNSQNMCNRDSFEKTIHINEPPVAEAGDDNVAICLGKDEKTATVSFDASNSTDVNKDPLTYEWDFGDGLMSTEIKPVHQYNDIGRYDVKLIVKDDTNMGCRASVDFQTVLISKAPVADAGTDMTTCTGEVIEFDGSNSFINKKGTVDISWDFGDGESSLGLMTDHVYKKPGTYQAKLTLENKLNDMCPQSIDTRVLTVNSPPEVSIKSPDAVCLGQKIFFDASSATDADGDTLQYFWSFGDGIILKNGPKVEHEFSQGGTYRATVIADDNRGTTCSTATAETQIRVNTPPIADAGPNLACCVNKIAKFDALGSSDPDGDSLSYIWDFGDGETKEGPIASHVYTKKGAYNVTLTVDDNSGTACSKSSSSFIANVNTAPVSVFTVR